MASRNTLCFIDNAHVLSDSIHDCDITYNFSCMQNAHCKFNGIVYACCHMPRLDNAILMKNSEGKCTFINTIFIWLVVEKYRLETIEADYYK